MSRRLAALNLLLRTLVKPRLERTAGPQEALRDFDLSSRWLLRRPAGIRHAERPGDLHWISACPCRPDRVILYFHGGGYITGSPYSHEGLIARLSRLSHIEVCAPAYPLAPDSPCPAPFNAAVEAWTRCRELGYLPENIALSGDSAGGGLALSLLGWCCEQGEPPGCAVVFSPWCDLTMTGQSLRDNADTDPYLPVDRMEELVALTLGKAARDDPRISPLYGRFPDCPPVMIHYSATEILADDARRMAARLREFGGDVALREHPDAPHAWPVFDGWIPEARTTLREAARFVQASLGAIRR
ncbi:hydrolase [Salipiger pallidus]|uniref:Hydrolase n=1 Tax=Salipiger pallidus TaxID=1775170 RepID=A0A8J2ZML5_9RHOB|nr:alpha/beta hydrolase fold domain-containing protein [Salipiger pallidus]GGG80816.1 hydrolase [Salipiger pallidus]